MITWLGHAGFKIECTDPSTNTKKIIYIDPWLTSPVCPESEKASPAANLILVTHGHMDHSADSVDLSKRTGATIVAIYELGNALKKLGADNVASMNKGGTYDSGYCSVTMVKADHSSSGPHEHQPAGEPVGFVIHFQDGSPAVYHAGDTNVFTDMKIVSDLYAPQVALLPIGGNYTMGPREAAYALTRLLESVKTVVPMHFGTYPILKGTPAELREGLRAAGSTQRVAEMQVGETLGMASLVN